MAGRVAVFGIFTSFFFGAGLVAPNLLFKIHERWMGFARILGGFNMKIILSVIYLAGFSLMRLILLILRKDPLQRKIDPSVNSYWVKHPEPGNDPKRFEKQY